MHAFVKTRNCVSYDESWRIVSEIDLDGGCSIKWVGRLL